MTFTAKLPIFDGHNDLLGLLPDSKEVHSFFSRSDQGHIDLPRIQEGGMGGGFFAVFVPSHSTTKDYPRAGLTGMQTAYDIPLPPPIDLAHAQEITIRGMATLFRLEAESAGQIKVVRTADEVEACLPKGILAAVLHLEGAEAIDPDLNALQVFYQTGLRSLGITWSRPNAFAHGVPFRFPHSPDTGPGLTDAGKELVRTCNHLGILLDVSHLNEKGFWDIEKRSKAPLVATHAGAHALCPSTRNLTDRQLDAIGTSAGVVGVNFHVAFLRQDGRLEDAPITEIVRHIDYIADRIGIGHVALGSDFDGATMPQELGDVAGLPKLLDALRSNGYDDRALEKIAYKNWIRVLSETWKA